MRKILFFFLVSLSVLKAQEIPKPEPKSGEVIVIDTDSIAKPAVIYDTLSYAEEYKRDYWRTFFGGKGGFNFHRFSIDENIIDRQGRTGLPVLDPSGNITKNVFINNPSFRTAYNAGIFFRFVRGSFFVQPELNYSAKSGTFDILNIDRSLYKRVNASFNTIELPTLLGVRTKKSRFFFGPVYSFAFKMDKNMKSSLAEFLDEDILNSSFFNRPIMNFQVGVSYEINGAFVDIRYEKGLKSYTVQQLGPVNSPQSFNLQANGIFITLGLLGN
jgi:hypothetical protein